MKRLLLVLTGLVGMLLPRLHAQPNVALPPIKTADHDQQGRFRVNGQAFFPILLYDAPADDATLGRLREFGFNVLTCDLQRSATLPAKGFYGAVHVDKKGDNLQGVFLALGTDSPALVFRKDLLKQTAAANAKVRAFVPGRPVMNAIGYWEDEPDGVFAGKLPSKEKYDHLVRELDVSAPYLYPVPYQPAASVGDAVARACAAGEGKKPVLAILQLFAWKAKDRYPTAEELRCMAFLALVEGASGIGYYSYGSVTGQPKTTIAEAQPELWKSVKKLNHDIARLGPQLAAGEKSQAFALDQGTSSVRAKVFKDRKSVSAVLVNSTAKRQEAKLVWQAPDAVGRLQIEGGEAVDVKNGSATVPLPPFGVAIVRWQPE